MSDFHPKTPKNCPPSNATHPTDKFYRIVFHDPPTADDFLIYALEPEQIHKLDKKKSGLGCRDFAISFYSTEDRVMEVCNDLAPVLQRRALARKGNCVGIALVSLDARSGVLSQTTEDLTHHDLWTYTSTKLDCNVINVDSIQKV